MQRSKSELSNPTPRGLTTEMGADYISVSVPVFQKIAAEYGMEGADGSAV